MAKGKGKGRACAPTRGGSKGTTGLYEPAEAAGMEKMHQICLTATPRFFAEAPLAEIACEGVVAQSGTRQVILSVVPQKFGDVICWFRKGLIGDGQATVEFPRGLSKTDRRLAIGAAGGPEKPSLTTICLGAGSQGFVIRMDGSGVEVKEQVVVPLNPAQQRAVNKLYTWAKHDNMTVPKAELVRMVKDLSLPRELQELWHRKTEEAEAVAAICQAIEKGRVACLKALVAQNPQVVRAGAHLEGQEPLHMAAERNNVGALCVLVGAGYPIDAVNEKYQTALQVSRKAGNVEAEKALLRLGAEESAPVKKRQAVANRPSPVGSAPNTPELSAEALRPLSSSTDERNSVASTSSELGSAEHLQADILDTRLSSGSSDEAEAQSLPFSASTLDSTCEGAPIPCYPVHLSHPSLFEGDGSRPTPTTLPAQDGDEHPCLTAEAEVTHPGIVQGEHGSLLPSCHPQEDAALGREEETDCSPATSQHDEALEIEKGLAMSQQGKAQGSEAADSGPAISQQGEAPVSEPAISQKGEALGSEPAISLQGEVPVSEEGDMPEQLSVCREHGSSDHLSLDVPESESGSASPNTTTSQAIPLARECPDDDAREMREPEQSALAGGASDTNLCPRVAGSPPMQALQNPALPVGVRKTEEHPSAVDSPLTEGLLTSSRSHKAGGPSPAGAAPFESRFEPVVQSAADSRAGCSQADAAHCQCGAGPVQSTLDGGAGPIAGDAPAGRQEAVGATGDGFDVASSTGAYTPTGSICGVFDLCSAANSDGEEAGCSSRAASAECPGGGSVLHNGGADPKAVIPTECASQDVISNAVSTSANGQYMQEEKITPPDVEVTMASGNHLDKEPNTSETSALLCGKQNGHSVVIPPTPVASDKAQGEDPQSWLSWLGLEMPSQTSVLWGTVAVLGVGTAALSIGSCMRGGRPRFR